MTTLREAAAQALDALESLEVRCTDSETVTAWYPEATNKLREALAQPEPEPVAWTNMSDANDWLFLSGRANPNGKLKGEWEALYTHPPQRKPLMDDDLEPLRIRIMGEAYNAADEGQSEEYNAIKVLCAVLLDLVKRAVTSLDTANSKEAQLDYIAQQIKSVVSSFNISKSLPVADTESDVLTATYMLGVHAGKKVANRKPLTVEQLRDIKEHQRLLEELGPVWAPMLYYFCQAIERAHGIGEKE